MAAYAIFIKEKTRVAAGLEPYNKLAGPSLDGHPAKVLAAYGQQECPEGAASEGVVLLEFPTMVREHCRMMEGWMISAMEVLGATVLPGAQESTCMADKGPYHEFVCKWQK